MVVEKVLVGIKDEVYGILLLCGVIGLGKIEVYFEVVVVCIEVGC